MIEQNARNLLDRLPISVTIVAAAKTRSVDEVREAIAGGVHVIGENYVQEARAHIEDIRGRSLETAAESGLLEHEEPLARNIQPLERKAFVSQPGALAKHSGLAWHMIGHLQRNKVKEAVRLFDLIQTVDSLRLAKAIDRACEEMGCIMPILIEVNAAREPQKSGVLPEAVINFVNQVAQLESVHVRGLMTMGPFVDDPEQLRPIFRETKVLFDRIASEGIPSVSMDVLSMGMSDSYVVAIEEGATMIRLGTTIFGPRG
ncbi:YggS family pyridoxal phosphate-dependent enzyme [Candidatus Bipolaricaulota bacterium]